MLAGRAAECCSFVCCALPSRAIKSTLDWDIARKFWFSFTFIAVLCAKSLHIYAHWDAVPLKKLSLWGSTFFLQDFFFLLLAYAFTQNFERKIARIAAGIVVVPTR